MNAEESAVFVIVGCLLGAGLIAMFAWILA
jgi:hypothetical protein